MATAAFRSMLKNLGEVSHDDYGLVSCAPAVAVTDGGRFHVPILYADPTWTEKWAGVFSGVPGAWTYRTLPVVDPSSMESHPVVAAHGSSVYVACVENDPDTPYSEKVVLYRSTGGAFTKVDTLVKYAATPSYDIYVCRTPRMAMDANGDLHILMPVLELKESATPGVFGVEYETYVYRKVSGTSIGAAEEVWRVDPYPYPYWMLGGGWAHEQMGLVVDGTIPTVYAMENYRTAGSTYTKGAIAKITRATGSWVQTRHFETATTKRSNNFACTQLAGAAAIIATHTTSTCTWIPGVHLFNMETLADRQVTEEPYASRLYIYPVYLYAHPTSGFILGIQTNDFTFCQYAESLLVDGTPVEYNAGGLSPFFFTFNKYPSAMMRANGNFVGVGFGGWPELTPSLLMRSYSPTTPTTVGDLTIQKERPVLELVRNLEIQVDGRAFVDREGNFNYESRYTRHG